MKTTKRKRKERRLRILERNAMKRRARETAVAANLGRERRTEHRENLFRKYEDAKLDLSRTDEGPAHREKERKLSFFERLLGRRA